MNIQEMQEMSTQELETLSFQANTILCQRKENSKAKEKQAANKEAGEILMQPVKDVFKLCSNFKLKHVSYASPCGELGICTEPFNINYVTALLENAAVLMNDVKHYFV